MPTGLLKIFFNDSGKSVRNAKKKKKNEVIATLLWYRTRLTIVHKMT